MICKYCYICVLQCFEAIMFRFESASFFWLLLLIPVLIFLYLRYLSWRRKSVRLLGKAEMVQQLLPGAIPGRATTKIVLTLLAIVSGIFGLVNLQAGDQSSSVMRRGVDVVFAIDVSKSMLAKDISPDRLSRAKLLVQAMLSKMSNDKVGLVLFAGRAYLQSPLTMDYGTIKMLLNTTNTSSAPTQGTVLSDAIEMSQEAFDKRDRKFKTIILISDGEDHDARAVELAKQAAEDGIIIHTIGIGSPAGAPIFDPETGSNKLDQNGQEVITKLNEAVLKEVAEAGRGTYQLLANNNLAAGNLLNEIAKMESRNMGANMFLHYKSYYQYFLLFSLLLILVNIFIPNTRRVKLQAV